jgi:hypothetical protein
MGSSSDNERLLKVPKKERDGRNRQAAKKFTRAYSKVRPESLLDEPPVLVGSRR